MFVKFQGILFLVSKRNNIFHYKRMYVLFVAALWLVFRDYHSRKLGLKSWFWHHFLKDKFLKKKLWAKKKKKSNSSETKKIAKICFFYSISEWNYFFKVLGCRKFIFTIILWKTTELWKSYRLVILWKILGCTTKIFNKVISRFYELTKIFLNATILSSAITV